MGDLEQRKLEAEIARIQAETRGLQPTRVDAMAKWLKLIGAGVIGLGGLLAAVTTYQITEAKTAAAHERVQTVEALAAAADAHAELAKLRQEQAEKALLETNVALGDRRRELEELQAKAAATKAALDQVLAELERSSSGTALSRTQVAQATQAIAAVAREQEDLQNGLREAIDGTKRDQAATLRPHLRTVVPTRPE